MDTLNAYCIYSMHSMDVEIGITIPHSPATMSSSFHQSNDIKSQTKKILAIDTLRGYAIDSENTEFKLYKIDDFSRGENNIEKYDIYFKYIKGEISPNYDCIVICCSDQNLANEKEIETLCLKIFLHTKIYIIGSRAPLFTHWFSQLPKKPNFGEIIAVSRIKNSDSSKIGMVCGLFTRHKNGDNEFLVQINGINTSTNNFNDLKAVIESKMSTYSPTSSSDVKVICVAVYPEGFEFKPQRLVSTHFSHKDTDRAKGALLFGKNKMNENLPNYIEIKEHQDATVTVMKAVKESPLSSSIKSSTTSANIIQSVKSDEEQHRNRDQPKHIFAIDIGTTSSRAAIAYNDKNGKEKYEKVPLKGVNDKMPSIVNFCENQTYKGCEAEENYVNSSDAKINSENTVYDITHFMGKSIDEINVNHFLHFTVEENRDFIKIKLPTGTILPEVACGELLKYIAHEADEKLKAEINPSSIVTHATLTTPVFNSQETKIRYETALKCAAQLASLKVVDIIDASTAVLIDYIFKLKKLSSGNFNICAIDIGGGTTDIVAYNVESNVEGFCLKPILKYGNSKFNGRNFDIALAEKIKSVIESKLGRTANIGSNFSLLSKAEQMKIKLSSDKSADFTYIFNEETKESASATISRKDFQNCIFHFIESFKKEVTKISEKLEENGQNSEVLLIGNSSKIPVINKTIKNIFSNTIDGNGLSPARGAAYHTAKLQKSNNQISLYKY